jgi:predicted Zn-dependent peptidase
MLKRTLTSAAFVALSLAVTTAQAPPAAQQTSPTKGVVIKGKAPVSDAVLKVTLPKAEHADLANGAHLIVLEDHRVPLVAIQIQMRGTGGYYDPAEMPGLASVTAAMISEGTKTRTSQQIATEIDTLAATGGAGTSSASEITVLNMGAMTEHLDKVLEIATDMLINPTFPEQELANYKTRMKGVLLQQRAQPGFLAQEAYGRVVFGSHPAGRMMTPEALDKITRDAIVNFHATRYAPDYAVIGVVGDVTLADIKKRLDAKLAGWTKKGLPKLVVADPAAIGPAKVTLVNRPGSVQTNLIVGTQLINRTSPDYDVVKLADSIIGGGPTGRLFLNLREDKGYTYGSYSRMTTLRYRGDWSASAEVRTDVTEPALTEMMKEVARMRDERIPDKEFADKKRSLVASFALSLESPGAILSDYITSWIYNLPADYWNKYPARVMAITQDQVQAAAKKYFDASRLQIVAVGDGKKIADGLKKFGKLEMFDAEGKPIQQ